MPCNWDIRAKNVKVPCKKSAYKERVAMQLVIFNLVIVIGVELLFLPLWMTKIDVIAPIEIFFNLMLFPVLLCVFNSIMFLKGKMLSFKMLYLLLPIMCLVIQLMGYVNWGIATGRFFKPDEETIMLVTYFISISSVYSIILVGISNVILLWLKKF